MRDVTEQAHRHGYDNMQQGAPIHGTSVIGHAEAHTGNRLADDVVAPRNATHREPVMSKTLQTNVLQAADGWTVAANLSFSDGPDVDRTVWTSPHWISSSDNPSFLGRTALRNLPDFGIPLGCVPVANGRAQLILSSWNPRDPDNTSFLGAQISTREKWGLGSYEKVAFQARVRCPFGMPGGAVASLFSYNLLSTDPFQHDEIDFEFASNYWQGAHEAINTNVYLDDNSGIDLVVPTTVDFSGPIDFMIVWSSEDIRWYINDALVRTETSVPQSDMSLTLNVWVPGSDWGWAYNADLQAATAPGTQWIYEVDWANVYVQGAKGG
ncbi:hypothetical protein GCM10023307_08660 [Lysobacter hankyongensis]|uniref:GH16 domain-containing protein n=2 Tax=Lysobacter hankyongensis TaxID=1176535 RepID=A0ABP9AVC1_9GAMM